MKALVSWRSDLSFIISFAFLNLSFCSRNRVDGFHLYSWFSPQQRSKRLQPRQDLKGIACILWCKLSRKTLSPPGSTVETEFAAWRENLFWDNFRQSTALFFHVAAVTMNLIKSSSQTILHHPKALHNHSISLCHVRQRHRGSISTSQARWKCQQPSLHSSWLRPGLGI